MSPKSSHTPVKINPYALGGAFLKYCLKRGWIAREGRGRDARYVLRTSGARGLASFEIEEKDIRARFPNEDRINRDWHRAHRMPRNATLEQRLAWHRQHAAHCRCRPVPPKLRALMDRTPARRA